MCIAEAHNGRTCGLAPAKPFSAGAICGQLGKTTEAKENPKKQDRTCDGFSTGAETGHNLQFQ